MAMLLKDSSAVVRVAEVQVLGASPAEAMVPARRGAGSAACATAVESVAQEVPCTRSSCALSLLSVRTCELLTKCRCVFLGIGRNPLRNPFTVAPRVASPPSPLPGFVYSVQSEMPSSETRVKAGWVCEQNRRFEEIEARLASLQAQLFDLFLMVSQLQRRSRAG